MAQLTSMCAQSPCWKESSRTNIMNEAERYFLLYLIAVRLCMGGVVDSWNVDGHLPLGKQFMVGLWHPQVALASCQTTH